MTLKPTDWIWLTLLAFVLLYIGARLVASAWYRTRREHLIELARLFKGVKSSRTKLTDTTQSNSPKESKHGN